MAPRVPSGIAMICVALMGALTIVADRASAASVEREVAYGASDSASRDRSYDLFPAVEPGGALVIFIHGRFWQERQPDRLVEEGFVRGLLRAGHSVAVLRHRLGAEGRHPAATEDVAKGVGGLLRRVAAGEFDSERVYLAGHSSGAQLALLLALDPSWLAAAGSETPHFAGVIALSGIYDLTEDPRRSAEEEGFIAAAFPSAAARRAASPSNHVNPSLPAILLMNAERDIPGAAAASQRFAARLRERGQPAVEVFVANGRDYFSMLDLSNPGAPPQILELLASSPREGQLPESWQISSTWRNPPFTTADFHSDFAALVDSYRVDAHFQDVVNRPFRSAPGAPDRLRFGRYTAVDLQALLTAMGPGRVGAGEWLEVTNVRGEKISFPMEQIRALAPRVVIGVDGEKNLFRATDLYHTRRRYSWVDANPKRVDMARPLGGFLFFPGEEPSAKESSRLIGRYGLTSDSFRLRAEDPLAPIRSIAPIPRRILLGENHCLSCHQFRGVGGSAFHLRARDGAPMGGYALPLERYPEVVWKRFVFEQEDVAEEVGATPVDFAPGAARALYELVAEERKARGVTPWKRPERDRPGVPQGNR